MVKVLVSSHRNYTNPLSKLLSSLLDQGVPVNDIIVAMAGDVTDSIEIAEQGYTIIHSRRNLHELTSMVEIAQYWGLAVGSADTCVVAIHDTCIVLPCFWPTMNHVAAKMKANNTDMTWLCRCKLYNMVIGNRNFYERLRCQFQDISNLSKYEAWLIEIKQHPRYSIEMDCVNVSALSEPQVYQGLVDIYKTGVLRMKALLPGAHVYKFFCLNNFEKDPSFKHPLTA